MDFSDSKSLVKLGTILAASAFTGSLLYSKLGPPRTKWVKVGTVDKLFVHPLKGGKPVEVFTAELGWLGIHAGPFIDRSFMLVNKSNKSVYSMDCPKTVLIRLEYQEGKLIFKADGMEDLVVDEADLVQSPERTIVCQLLDSDISCTHLGKRYDEWVSQFLYGEPEGLKLVHFGRNAARPARPSMLAMWPESYLKTDLTTFNNTTSYNILTWGSVHSLNKQFGLETTPEWYRPTIVVKTIKDEPYEEETWRKRIRIGRDAILHFVKECQRCRVITVDPKTGIRDERNLEKLRTFRLMEHGFAGSSDPRIQTRRMNAMGKSPFFSVNFGTDTTGFVSVGDDVYAEFEE